MKYLLSRDSGLVYHLVCHLIIMTFGLNTVNYYVIPLPTFRPISPDPVFSLQGSDLMKETSLEAISNVYIGHAHDLEGATGCSVVICPEGAVTGVDVRGGAPGTRETDLLDPLNLVDRVHAVLLAGGSAFGLEAASGVMRYLEERGIGFDTGVARIPLVPSAVLFDLSVGDPSARPDAAMGYKACVTSGYPLEEGNVGAGMGASIGKIRGMEFCMKGGLGCACLEEARLRVGAMVAVNSLGDVYDQSRGEIIAGALGDDRKSFINTEDYMISSFARCGNLSGRNTTIGVVITNALMTKSQACKVASMAHSGIARAVRPSHTMFDGDTLFTMATGNVETDVNVVGIMAVMAVEKAILRAVRKASSLCGILSWQDLHISEGISSV